MIKIEDYLKNNQIEYKLYEHPAVFTCQEAEKHCGNIPGMASKNLFLKDEKEKRLFLLIMPAAKRADLKQFAKIALAKKVSFGNAELLKEKLGLEAGSVSPFGLLNDEKIFVELYVDRDIYNAPVVSFHPNRNTASLVLSQEMFHKFLENISHKLHLIEQ